MEKHVLSKSTFIRGVQCLKSLYLHKKRPFLRDRLSAIQRAKFKRGTDVGVLARQLFPGGVNLQPKSPSQYRKALQETQAAIKDENIKVIYEAGFQHEGVIVFMDVLVRDKTGWKAYEVKSSKKISETYRIDAALQYYVINNSGLPVNDISIVYIDENYRLGDALEIASLFKIESVLSEVKKRQQYITQQIEKEKKVINLKHSPKISIGMHCYRPYPCDFIGHCWKHVPGPSVFDVLGTSSELAYRLHAGDKALLSDEEAISGFSPQQKKLAALLLNRAEKLDCEKLRKTISENRGPQYYIHLLMNRPAIPYQKGYHPYQPLPAGMAVLVSKQRSTEMHSGIFSFNENVEKAVVDFCKNIFVKTGKIFIYEQSNEEGMQWLIKHGAIDKDKFDTFNLKSIPEEHNYFHPDVFPDHSLENLGKLFNRQLKPGQNESLLLMEYGAAYFNNALDNDELLKGSLESYLVSCVEIQRIFYNFILEKCQENQVQRNN